MRRLHGHCEGPSNPLLHYAGEIGGRSRNQHTRRHRNPGQAASAAKGLHRRAGSTMRILYQRRDHDGQGIPGQKSPCQRAGDPKGHVQCALPLLHQCADAPRDPAGGAGDDTAMKTALTQDARSALAKVGFSRRDFLKTSGALIVTFSSGFQRARAQGFGGGPTAGSPAPNQLDSWIAIAADGSIIAYSGKEELGQGIDTAQTQLVAEELSVPFERVKLIYCDTGLTPDQAYTAGSQSHPANSNRNNLGQAAAT